MIEIYLPIKIESENHNLRTHWAKRHKKNKKIALAISLALNPYTIALPCIVVLIRLGPRQLDSDNLQGALKCARDAISAYLTKKPNGQGDNDSRIVWQYKQEIAKSYGFKFQI